MIQYAKKNNLSSIHIDFSFYKFIRLRSFVCVPVPSVSSKTSADAIYHYSLGVLLRLDGKIEEATNELKKAVAADPGSSYLLTELVSLYTEQGDLNEAISLAKKCFLKILIISNSI